LKHDKAPKLIDKIIAEADSNGIIVDNLIEDLLLLRTYAVEEKNPVVAKALRLCVEHLEDNENFIIPIPMDEPLEDEDTTNQLIVGTESFIYLMNLIKKSLNKLNKEEIREYNKLMEI
jgi:hypothetical protein